MRSQATAFSEIRTSLPVLSPGDRRSFLKSLWSPLIPESAWSTARPKPLGTAQVYLDVSGSMHAELQALVGLMGRLRRYLRMPFWAFSDQVAPAEIQNGALKTATSGGTSMNSVLAHVAKTRPGKAVIITDGYIEKCNASLLREVADQEIRVVLSRDGSAQELERARIPYVQLDRFPS